VDVVKDAMAADEIELRIPERELHDVTLLEANVRRRRRSRNLEVLHARVDADDLRHDRGERERDRARSTPGVEGVLVSGERAEEASHTLSEVVASLLLEREP
jgi:hypothetical protein